MPAIMQCALLCFRKNMSLGKNCLGHADIDIKKFCGDTKTQNPFPCSALVKRYVSLQKNVGMQACVCMPTLFFEENPILPFLLPLTLPLLCSLMKITI